jgi:hypothetical protein
MESNPEEFYGDASKWAFMFAPNFRDVMTEPEKGALHEALKEARRKEFDELVMRRILRDTEEETVKQARPSGAIPRQQMISQMTTSLNDVFGAAHIRAEGQQIAYDSQQHRDAHNKAYNALSNSATNYNPALNTQNPYK